VGRSALVVVLDACAVGYLDELQAAGVEVPRAGEVGQLFH
jgi:hypothetical protein